MAIKTVTDVKHRLMTIAQGQAGVHRVLAELVVRGHSPYVPVVDTGVDILLGSGVRLQIKSTMRASSHWRLREGTFLFTLSKAQTIKQQQYVPRSARQFSQICDFIILWAIEPDRFWVVPAQVLDGRHTAAISDSKQWRDLDRDQILTLKAQGLTVTEIAKQAGVAPKTVIRRLTTFQSPKRKYTDLPLFENRWDLITGVVAALNEATHLVASTPGTEPVPLLGQDVTKERNRVE